MRKTIFWHFTIFHIYCTFQVFREKYLLHANILSNTYSMMYHVSLICHFQNYAFIVDWGAHQKVSRNFIWFEKMKLLHIRILLTEPVISMCNFRCQARITTSWRLVNLLILEQRKNNVQASSWRRALLSAYLYNDRVIKIIIVTKFP